MDKNIRLEKKLPGRYWIILGLTLLASICSPFFYPPDEKPFTTVIAKPNIADVGFRAIAFIAFLVILSAFIYFVRQAFDDTFPLKVLPAITILILVFIVVGANLKAGMEANASEQIFPSIVWVLGPLVLLFPIWIVAIVMLIKARLANPSIHKVAE